MGFVLKENSQATTFRFGILASFIAIIIVVVVSTNFVLERPSRNNKLLKTAQELEKRYKCFTCRNCRGKDCDTCDDMKLECSAHPLLTVEGQIKPDCLKTKNELSSYTQKEAKKLLQLQQRLEPNLADYLQNFVSAAYEPARYSVQYFPYPRFNGINTVFPGKWQKIKHYDIASSSYTVLTRPNAFSNGSVTITERGIYLVYGKVTVACIKADGQLKRIQLKITSFYERNTKALLHGEDESKCETLGDLLTIFQSEFVDLKKSTKISLHIKLPEGVILSQAKMPFKTYLGIHKMSDTEDAHL